MQPEQSVSVESEGGATYELPKQNRAPKKKRTLRKKRTQLQKTNVQLTNSVPVQRNPFENRPTLSIYEVLKRLIVGITLFPIRIVVFVFTILILWALCRLTILGFPLVADRGCYYHKEPLSTWRYVLATPIPLLFRIFLWTMGFWSISVVDHREDTSFDPHIVVIGPHVTMFDMFVMMYVYPRSGFLGQHAVVKIPVLNSIGTVTQGMFIDIADKDSKYSAKAGIAMRASPDWKGGHLLIFPEGTITNGRQLVQFKAGAFTPGQPVQPVILRYPWKNYDISWVGKNRDWKWGFRCALQVVNFCEVDILDVYRPSEEEKANAILFANNVRDVMAAWDNLQTTEHTYDDVFFYREAVGAGVGNDFLVKDMKKMFDADLETLKLWLNIFQEADEDGSGMLSAQEVMRALKIKGHESAFKQIFNFFDSDQSGGLEYREFVQILALLSGKSSAQDLAMLSYIVCDTAKTEVVGKGLLVTALDKMFRHKSHSFDQDGSMRAMSTQQSTLTSEGSKSFAIISRENSYQESKSLAVVPNEKPVTRVDVDEFARSVMQGGSSGENSSHFQPQPEVQKPSVGRRLFEGFEHPMVTLAEFHSIVEEKQDILKDALREMRRSSHWKDGRRERLSMMNLQKVQAVARVASIHEGETSGKTYL